MNLLIHLVSFYRKALLFCVFHHASLTISDHFGALSCPQPALHWLASLEALLFWNAKITLFNLWFSTFTFLLLSLIRLLIIFRMWFLHVTYSNLVIQFCLYMIFFRFLIICAGMLFTHPNPRQPPSFLDPLRFRYHPSNTFWPLPHVLKTLWIPSLTDGGLCLPI